MEIWQKFQFISVQNFRLKPKFLRKSADFLFSSLFAKMKKMYFLRRVRYLLNDILQVNQGNTMLPLYVQANIPSSATLVPVTMVPFFREPTCRTSSICWNKNSFWEQGIVRYCVWRRRRGEIFGMVWQPTRETLPQRETLRALCPFFKDVFKRSSRNITIPIQRVSLFWEEVITNRQQEAFQ